MNTLTLDSATQRQVRCPSCQQWCVYSQSNPYRPFCSAGCKGLDLGAWASESFRVPEQDTGDGALEAPAH